MRVFRSLKSDVSEGHVRIIEDIKRKIIESDLDTLQKNVGTSNLLSLCCKIKRVQNIVLYSLEAMKLSIIFGVSKAYIKDNFQCSMWEFEDSNMAPP